MIFSYRYHTPKGFSDLYMTCDDNTLIELRFEGSRDIAKHTSEDEQQLTPVFEDTIRWLDIYFSGRNPDFTPNYRVNGLTPFRSAVIDAMLKIPYGQTVTYGDIAKEIALSRGLKRMSAQAVGGAVGWNPLCILIPCHRVVGASGSLVGYGGGMQNKVSLLQCEGIDIRRFVIPTKGTAL